MFWTYFADVETSIWELTETPTK